MRSIFIIALTAVIMSSCTKGKNNYDASGTFEAEETIISSEASGVIKEFTIEEGQQLKAGEWVGYVDSMQLYLRKKQLEAQVKAGLSQRPDIATQLGTLKEQLKAAEKERIRFTNLVKADAATQKQLDDINNNIEVLKKQIAAQESSLGIMSESITQQSLPVMIQIEQLNDQLHKCNISNAVKGTVLSKYASVNEMTAPGKPLYKIADFSEIILRAYITGDQLSQIKLNQKIKVLVDDGADKYKELDGTITWINDKSEFTPKTIQTKNERANMVYAIKVKVKNDGFLKIGMYAEIKF
jgi:HlyD family secretion protein